ncbi:hypothetical protein ISS86_01235 [Candidatus Microgenomates bacterium]|nr:hypothetical protein [Candidatus Microgenomates bacterium]
MSHEDLSNILIQLAGAETLARQARLSSAAHQVSGLDGYHDRERVIQETALDDVTRALKDEGIDISDLGDALLERISTVGFLMAGLGVDGFCEEFRGSSSSGLGRATHEIIEALRFHVDDLEISRELGEREKERDRE